MCTSRSEHRAHQRLDVVAAHLRMRGERAQHHRVERHRLGRPTAPRPRRRRRRRRCRSIALRPAIARPRRPTGRPGRAPASSVARPASGDVALGDLGVQHLAGRRRRRRCRAAPSASYSRSCSDLNSRKSNSRRISASSGSTVSAPRSSTSIGASRRSTISSAFDRARASLSISDLAQLRRLLVDVGEDAVETAVRVDQLGRGLLADTRHAGQVVAGVAAHAPRSRRTAPA